MDYIEKIREKIKTPKSVDVLTEDMMWQHQGPLLWKADRFDGMPAFYPVYRYNNYYSYSPLALILHKNTLHLNPAAVKKLNAKDFILLGHDTPIDQDVERIGASHGFTEKITDAEDYCRMLVEAIKTDIAEIEKLNPGFINVIMCGGKDSLNLLLLPWQNPVVAYSAVPNYPLVCDFVKENNLDIEVRLLEDSFDENYLQDEIAELCCRLDSVHWRWGHHIKKITDDYSKKLIIWKGQMADAYFAPRWKTYIYPENEPRLFFCKVYNKLSPYLPMFLSVPFGHLISRMVADTVWNKGAISQGDHMAFIRALTDTLVLSAYHGKNVQKVLSSVDLAKAVQKDVRMKIGEMLHGKPVIYPSSNPSPKLSGFREGSHKPEKFIDLLKKHGVDIIGQNGLSGNGH
ncbi:MAG: hypothetical protein R3D86_00285 [Emcibacteraceae bacterium]